MVRRPRHKKNVPVPAVQLPQESRHLWIVCGLCATGFLIYANTFASSFHLDDRLVIVNNPAIRNPWDLSALFNAFNTRLVPGWTFAVNHALGGLDVFGYHFFNIWLHVCNAALIYALAHQVCGLLKREKDAVWIALAASVIFLVHPIQTQAVNYIWQRTTLLAVFFYLLTVVLYFQARLTRARPYYWGAIATCLAAMLSKEISFTLPLMILIVEMILIRPGVSDKRSVFWSLPFLLMLTVIPVLLQRTGGLTLAIMRPFDMMSGVSAEVISRGEYWMTQVNAIATYVRLFIWPVGLNIDHDYPKFSQSGWGIWVASLTLVFCMIMAAAFAVRRNLLVTLGIVWFFVTLSIESIVISADILVEHRLYLPSIGLCFVLAAAWNALRQRNHRLGLAVLIFFTVTFGFMSVSRNSVWRNDITLWGDVIRKSPNKARGYNNRGIVYKKLNMPQLALDDFNRAIMINPRYPEAYYNRGGVHKMTGNLESALNDYAKTIELEPDNFQGFDARGYIHRRQGKLTEALEDFKTSIRLNPRNPEVYNNRAYIYQKQGRKDLALADYTQAISADPGYVYAYNNRGNLYLEEGEYTPAIADYSRALDLQPAFGEPYVNRAVANFRLKRYTESWEDVRRARQLGMRINGEFLEQLRSASGEEK